VKDFCRICALIICGCNGVKNVKVVRQKLKTLQNKGDLVVGDGLFSSRRTAIVMLLYSGSRAALSCLENVDCTSATYEQIFHWFAYMDVAEANVYLCDSSDRRQGESRAIT